MSDRDTRHEVDATAARRQEAPRAGRGPVAQLLIAWAPLSWILILYAVAQWINAPLDEGGATSSNRLGLGLHVAGPAGLDHAVFRVVPSVWLQQRLVDGSPHWYDAVVALVYVTHFVSIPLVTGIVWFRMRDRFVAWLAAVLTLSSIGIAGYVLYPAAPPWLASDWGAIGRVDRISGSGWQYLHLDPVAHASALGQGASNPVAAMPSLHAGAALLVAGFLWPLTRWPCRVALSAYVVLMALTLVYSGEHYVTDVAAGWLAAGVALAVMSTIHPRDGRSRSHHAD